MRDDHVIGIRWKHGNVWSRDVLISRFLLGNLDATALSCYMELNPVVNFGIALRANEVCNAKIYYRVKSHDSFTFTIEYNKN